MQISVDGAQRETDVSPGTMGRLISNIKSDLLATGKVVLSLSVDGRAIDAEYERQICELPVEKFGELSVETADSKKLCLATLDEVHHHIAPIIDEAVRISDLLDAGKQEQALGRVISCTEVWGAIVKAVHNIAQLMQIDIDQVRAGDQSLRETLRSVVALLQTIKNHMDSRDFVGIRDTMKHEIPEVAKRFDAQLTALSRMLSAT
jgi:hypothetical protein